MIHSDTQLLENRVVHICSAFAMRRSDKQPDRVEISPEQLSAAAIEAEVREGDGRMYDIILCIMLLLSNWR